eukprot:scaffold11481_cov18-Tisochrysis_lutea.AAC.1
MLLTLIQSTAQTQVHKLAHTHTHTTLLRQANLLDYAFYHEAGGHDEVGNRDGLLKLWPHVIVSLQMSQCQT